MLMISLFVVKPKRQKQDLIWNPLPAVRITKQPDSMAKLVQRTVSLVFWGQVWPSSLTS